MRKYRNYKNKKTIQLRKQKSTVNARKEIKKSYTI